MNKSGRLEYGYKNDSAQYEIFVFFGKQAQREPSGVDLSHDEWWNTEKTKTSYCAESFLKPYSKRPDLFTVNVKIRRAIASQFRLRAF